MTDQKIDELIEMCTDENFYMILGSLISAETLTDNVICRNNLCLADRLIESINRSCISSAKKKLWTDKLMNCKTIIKKDLELFENE